MFNLRLLFIATTFFIPILAWSWSPGSDCLGSHGTNLIYPASLFQFSFWPKIPSTDKPVYLNINEKLIELDKSNIFQFTMRSAEFSQQYLNGGVLGYYTVLGPDKQKILATGKINLLNGLRNDGNECTPNSDKYVCDLDGVTCEYDAPGGKYDGTMVGITLEAKNY